MREKGTLKLIDRLIGVPFAFLLGTTTRMWQKRRTETTTPRKILIIKLSAVGDSVLAVPAWRSLRETFAHARFTVLCSAITHEVVRTIPYFDHLIELDIAGMLRRPHRLADFLRHLRACQFDLVVDFDQWMRTTALLSLATGAPKRVGFDTRHQHRRFCYTDTIRPPRDRHEVDNFLDLAVAAGAKRGSRQLQMWIPPEEVAWARQVVAAVRGGDGTVVAFHPGCGGAGVPRQWPLQSYIELGNRLTRLDSIAIVVTGSSSEVALAEQIAGQIGGKAASLAGAHSITRFAAILQCCDLLVCGNTGAMHIAAAVGTPTVALHGPTNPRKWGPVGEGHVVIQSPMPCSPCLELGFDYGCSTHPCMRMIPVERVLDAIRQLLHRG